MTIYPPARRQHKYAEGTYNIVLTIHGQIYSMYPSDIVRSQKQHSLRNILHSTHASKWMRLINLRLLRRIVL